jgi:hypothetical protein
MSEPICLTIDDAATISRIRWRVASSGPWPAENTLEHPLECIVIHRPPLTDIEIEVTWGASGRRLRAGQWRAGGRSRGNPPLLGVPLREHWTREICEGRGARTTRYVLPAVAPRAVT